MKIISGVLIADEGRILCGVRANKDAPHFGYLAAPWGRAEDGEDPYETAVREAREGLDGQKIAITRISACAPAGNGYVLYLFSAAPCGEIDLGRHGPKFSALEWLTPQQIRSRGKVVLALLEILDTLGLE